jgi:hypothetical protein
METCQEMSQTPPATAEAVAITEVQTVQGILLERVCVASRAKALAVVVTEGPSSRSALRRESGWKLLFYID